MGLYRSHVSLTLYLPTAIRNNLYSWIRSIGDSFFVSPRFVVDGGILDGEIYCFRWENARFCSKLLVLPQVGFLERQKFGSTTCVDLCGGGVVFCFLSTNLF